LGKDAHVDDIGQGLAQHRRQIVRRERFGLDRVSGQSWGIGPRRARWKSPVGLAKELSGHNVHGGPR
jgi:hypothetical protein